MNESILTKWEDIKSLICETEMNINKNAKGNNAAGIRARKQLRLLKKELSLLIKITLEKGEPNE